MCNYSVRFNFVYFTLKLQQSLELDYYQNWYAMQLEMLTEKYSRYLSTFCFVKIPSCVFIQFLPYSTCCICLKPCSI